MKLKLLGLAILLPFSYFGQEKVKNFCSSHKSKTNLQKSNTLSVSEIVETEKYDVTYYQVDLSMNNLSTNVSGTGEIRFVALETIDSALFELFSTLTITEIRVNNIPTNFSRNQHRVKVPVNAQMNDVFIISIDYNGTPPSATTNPLGGSGMTNASSPSWGNRVTWSLSEPFSAFEWWPCKQSLTDKADSSKVNITVPSNCKAGSNGLLSRVVNLGNGFSRYEWVNNYPIDYYLISVAIAEYVDYSIFANPTGSTSPVLIQNYIYNNPQTLPYFKAEIDATVNFIELFSDLYGPYPFQNEKYGHCMAPLSGGMEHQTMTTLGFFEKQLTAHELAHQWWGNHVTCNSWTDIWVNEGFAAYSEYLMLENLYPNQKNQDMLDRHNDVMSQPGGSIWVLDSLNSNTIFDNRITYNKGSSFIHTLRYIIQNDSLFFQALRNFQSDFEHTTADALDIKQRMEALTGLDLTSAFEEWFYGEGYPTYSVRWNTNNQNLIVEIIQTTSQPLITPYYTNPIDLKFTRSVGGDTIIRFQPTSNSTQFNIANISSITNLTAIDPNNWIINKTSGIYKDLSLLEIQNNTIPESSISISPNPTNGPVNIKLNDENEAELTVYDSKGKIILVKSLQKETDIDLGNRNSDLFIFKIESKSDGFKTLKIVKN